MRVDHEKRRIYIHQSDIDQYRKCPEQLRLDYRGEYLDYDTDSAMIGTLTHNFIENCLHFVIDAGDWPAATTVQDWVRAEQATLDKSWDSWWHQPQLVPDKATALKMVEACCLLWWQNVPPLLNHTNPLEWKVEVPFEIKVGTVTVWRSPTDVVGVVYEVFLRGHVDFFDGIKPWDWKTRTSDLSRDGWKLDRYDIQSTVYTFALSTLLGRDVNDFLFAYTPRLMPNGTQKYSFDTHLVTRNSGQWAKMIETAQAVARQALTLSDQPWALGSSDWWCGERWCSEFAQGRCMGEHMSIHPEAAVELTRLVGKVQPSDHSSKFEERS